jgi:hypothetical protein
LKSGKAEADPTLLQRKQKVQANSVLSQTELIPSNAMKED